MKKLLKKLMSQKMLFGISNTKLFFRCFLVIYRDTLALVRRDMQGKKMSVAQINALLWTNAHILEKGMSLPEPRPGYGTQVVETLFQLLDDAMQNEKLCNGSAFRNAIAVLRAYVDYHDTINFNVDYLKSELNKFKDISTLEFVSGLKHFTKQEMNIHIRGDYSEFSRSRHSIRHFSDVPVEEPDIYKAIDIARKTPSACNRQPWNVYWVKTYDTVVNVLNLQNGNRGFGENVGSILVLSINRDFYFGLRERKLLYIDGGLYGHMLLNALHYVGLGACPLNWCVDFEKDEKLHQWLGMSESEVAILIIAIGHLNDDIKASVSCRKTVEETLIIV